AIQQDLLKQLDLVENIIGKGFDAEKMAIYDQVKFRLKEFKNELKESLNASSEQMVYNLMQREVNPLMEQLAKQSSELEQLVKEYNAMLNPATGVIYQLRKNYDETVQKLNRTIARFIDRKQVEAQRIYPHYF